MRSDRTPSLLQSRRLIHNKEGASTWNARKRPTIRRSCWTCFTNTSTATSTAATFLDRAGKFAVGGLTVAAIFESLKPNYAWAQQVPKDDKRHQERATRPCSRRRATASIKGYFARPANASGQAARRCSSSTRTAGSIPTSKTSRAASRVANFIAFAPDGLTSVGGYPGDDEKGAAAFRTVDGTKMTEDFVAAAKWLKARPESNGKLGAVGFCFGGGIVNQLAVRLGRTSAPASPFYGRQPSAEDVPKIKAPLHAALRRQRSGRQRRHRRPTRRRSRPTTRRTQVYMYEGTQHGFHNDTTPRYDEAAAKLAWQRTLEFFNKYLRST